MRIFFSIAVLLGCLFMQSCSVRKTKDVAYLQSEKTSNVEIPKLNVFAHRNSKGKDQPVLIFVHGGNWNTGNKNTYGLLGRNFARRGVVTVIPDYTLSPNADYDAMAKEIAAVIQWTKEHIAEYGGDPSQIYVTGHSAGGHLAALAVINRKYGTKPNSVAGIILNDAAGLDMKHYLEEYPPTAEHDYLATWSDDPKKWQDASPIYFLDKDTPPVMVYVGKKTYASIKTANSRFLDALHQFQPDVEPIYINKSHIPMVLQYFKPCSRRFGEVEAFMASVQKRKH